MSMQKMRHRGTSNLLPITTSDDDEHEQLVGNKNNHQSRQSNIPINIKDHLRRKLPLPQRKRIFHSSLIILLSLYFFHRWTSQLLDYVRDKNNERLHDEKQRLINPKGEFPLLYYDIPRNIIPSFNWPVITRWFRPHNARIVYNAQRAIKEYGEDLRNLMARGKEHLQLNTKANVDTNGVADIRQDDPQFRQWFNQRASWLKGDHSQPNWPLSALPTPVNSDDKALVISAGDKQLSYLKTLVYTIRHIHQSNIKIRVVYRDDQDLTQPSMQEIQQIISLSNTGTSTNSDNNLQFINLSHYFDLDLAQLQGWNLKAFGMLAVAETQIAVLDADVLLLQSPESLFEQEGYLNTGALFYHDRVKPQFYWDVHTLVEWLQPHLSPKARKILTYGHTPSTSYYSEQIQEAGMILLDKNRRMLGLWAACLLFGRPDIRQYMQTDHMYGDKEVYWTAMEMLGEDYEFARYYPGVVGGTVTDFGPITTHLKLDVTESEVETIRQDAVATNQALCGRLLHFDDQGKPLWANGGYMLKEDDWASSADISQSAINPVWYVDGGDSTQEAFPNPWLPFWRNILQWHSTLKGENQVWALHRGMGVECLSPNARQIRAVNKDVADKARKAVQHYFETKQSSMHAQDLAAAAV